MRSDPADLALKNLERLVANDPLLRDIVHPSMPTARRRARFVPAVDVVEASDSWTLILELPGVPRDSVKVKLDGTRLSVSGDKPARREGHAKVAERETGPFTREFLLPFQVQIGGISARLDEGVLTIVLPRSGTSHAREVPID